MGPSYEYAAMSDRVIDGDTFEVVVDLGFRIFHKIHVRLRGIDTPELRSSNPLEREHAQQARDFVKGEIPQFTSLFLMTAKSAIYNRWEADVMYFRPTTGAWVSLADVLREYGFEKRESY